MAKKGMAENACAGAYGGINTPARIQSSSYSLQRRRQIRWIHIDWRTTNKQMFAEKVWRKYLVKGAVGRDSLDCCGFGSKQVEKKMPHAGIILV